MKFISTPVFGFTTRASQKVSVLQNEIQISEAYDPATGAPAPIRKAFVGIWDTGAMGTVIRKKIADALGLKPSGRCTVETVGENDTVNRYEVNTYLVNLYLPNNVEIIGARVAEGAVAGADLLIGMDIIGEGDFAITNCAGKTCWTFRAPSVEEIDFVKEINEHNRIYSRQTNPHAIPSLSAEERSRRKQKRKAEKAARRKNQ